MSLSPKAFGERHQAFLGCMVSRKEHDKRSEVYALFKSMKAKKKTKEKASTEKLTLSKRDVDDVKPVKKPSPVLLVLKTKGERVSVSKDDVITENNIVNARDDDVSKETVPSDGVESPSNAEKSSPGNGEKSTPRFRLRVVKRNESNDNSPQAIEIADENCRFPGNEKTPDEKQQRGQTNVRFHRRIRIDDSSRRNQPSPTATKKERESRMTKAFGITWSVKWRRAARYLTRAKCWRASTRRAASSTRRPRCYARANDAAKPNHFFTRPFRVK